MQAEKIIPVLLSVVVIVLVAIVQEKSRFFAAILASMPLSAPLALWIVYSSTAGDHEKTAEFAGSLVVGVLATLVFVIGTWLGLRQRWPLAGALAAGGAGWLAFVAGVPILLRLFR